MNWLIALPALLLGVVLTLQVATNKQLGEHLHNLYLPAVANMAIGLVATIALTLTLSREWPSAAMIRTSPWYAWPAGGVLGAVYLTGNILLAPKIGAGALVGFVVTGQIVFSILLDHFGWFGFAQHDANAGRLLGCALLIGGVALVSRY